MSMTVPVVSLDSVEVRARLQKAYDIGFRHGRQTRIWGYTWRVTMWILMIVGFETLLSSFGWYLLLAMGYDPSSFWSE